MRYALDSFKEASLFDQLSERGRGPTDKEDPGRPDKDSSEMDSEVCKMIMGCSGAPKRGLQPLFLRAPDHLNDSQKNAVNMAMTKRLSIIQVTEYYIL